MYLFSKSGSPFFLANFRHVLKGFIYVQETGDFCYSSKNKKVVFSYLFWCSYILKKKSNQNKTRTEKKQIISHAHLKSLYL